MKQVLRVDQWKMTVQAFVTCYVDCLLEELATYSSREKC